jgi:hypothetical protein
METSSRWRRLEVGRYRRSEHLVKGLTRVFFLLLLHFRFIDFPQLATLVTLGAGANERDACHKVTSTRLT